MKILKPFCISNWRIPFALILTLLIFSNASAEIKLVKKSVLLASSKKREIVNPVFAQNTLTGETLIVWSDGATGAHTDQDPLMGRLINAKGVPVGKAFKILGKPVSPQETIGSFQLEYNPTTDEYLIACAMGPTRLDPEGDPLYDIYILRLTSSGRPKGKPFNITGNDPRLQSISNNPLALKFYPKTGGYLFIDFTYFHPGINLYDYFGFLNPDGTLKGEMQKIDPYNGKPSPFHRLYMFTQDYAFTRSGKLLIPAILRDPNATPDVFFKYGTAAVDFEKLKTLKPTYFKTLEKVFYPNPPSIGTWGDGITPVAFAGDTPVVYYATVENLKGRKFTLDGKPAGAEYDAFNEPAKNIQVFHPAAAFAAIPGGTLGLLIAAEADGSSPTGLWAQAVDAKAKSTGSSVKLFTYQDSQIIDGATQVFALPVQPGDAVARYTWYGLTLGSGRHVLEKLDISVTIP